MFRFLVGAALAALYFMQKEGRSKMDELRQEIEALKAAVAEEKAQVSAKIQALEDQILGGGMTIDEITAELRGIRQTVEGFVEPGGEAAPGG